MKRSKITLKDIYKERAKIHKRQREIVSIHGLKGHVIIDDIYEYYEDRYKALSEIIRREEKLRQMEILADMAIHKYSLKHPL